jgi:hypothetical protein
VNQLNKTTLKFSTMAHFRFQGLEIWQFAFKIANWLYDIADELENKKLFRFAEQLRGASMSLTYNIIEKYYHFQEH